MSCICCMVISGVMIMPGGMVSPFIWVTPVDAPAGMGADPLLGVAAAALAGVGVAPVLMPGIGVGPIFMPGVGSFPVPWAHTPAVPRAPTVNAASNAPPTGRRRCSCLII